MLSIILWRFVVTTSSPKLLHNLIQNVEIPSTRLRFPIRKPDSLYMCVFVVWEKKIIKVSKYYL